MKDWPFPVLYLRFAQVSAEMKLMVWLRRTCSEWRIWSILGNGNWHSSQKWRCSIWSKDKADKRETLNNLALILFILQFKWKCVLWMLNYFLLSQFNMQRQLVSYFVCCVSLELGKHCCLFKNPDQFSIATLAQPIVSDCPANYRQGSVQKTCLKTISFSKKIAHFSCKYWNSQTKITVWSFVRKIILFEEVYSHNYFW